MGRVIKLIAGNLLVLLVILLSLNLVASIFLDIDFKRDFIRDDRSDLPNYAEKEWAEVIFAEFHELRTKYAPFVIWSRLPFRGRAVTVDGSGDRVHPATTDDPRGTVRFFGGSTMWGAGVDDEGTIPARFNALFPNYRVLNHGESGFNSRQELARLVNLVNQREPMDLAVFYDGFNDSGNLCLHGVGLNGSQRALQIDRRVTPPSWVLRALIGSIQEVLHTKFVQKKLGGYGRPSRCDEDSGYARRVAETVVNNWKVARAVARVGGGEFVAILQPVPSEGSPRIDHLEPGDTRRSARNQVYTYIREIVEREDLDWVHDFTDVYDGDEYIFIDHCHASENGHEIVAARLAEITRPLLRERRPGDVALR